MSAVALWLVCSAGLIGVIIGYLIGRDRPEIGPLEIFGSVIAAAVVVLILAMAAGLLASV